MARIRRPEAFARLMQELDSDKTRKFVAYLGKYGAIDSKGRYLHWDQFKWRVEKGDDESIAWLATKLSRRAISKPLPALQAENKSYFSYGIPDSLSAQLHSIDRLADDDQSISSGASLSSQEKNRYLIKSLMQEEAITSSQLEGSSTTREVAKEMLEKNLAPKDKSQQMILNNYLLMKTALEKQGDELSIELILELHQIATHAAIENQAKSGELRTDNSIFVADSSGENTFKPPDSSTIQTRLEHLCAFANADHSDRSNFIHPIVKAIILHFMIAYIHPFGDGNGRTARAIFYWSMLRSGYWLFEYVSISKFIQEKRSDYDKAFIYTESDEFDLTYFLYNQVDMIEKAVRSLYEYIDRKKQEFYDFMNWIESSSVAKTLKRGHLEILKEAVRNPGREFICKQVAIDFGTTENTARSYLNVLSDKNLLIKAQSKAGKTVIYVSPANLRERLKN
jgi:Fic family protein